MHDDTPQTPAAFRERIRRTDSADELRALMEMDVPWSFSDGPNRKPRRGKYFRPHVEVAAFGRALDTALVRSLCRKGERSTLLTNPDLDPDWERFLLREAARPTTGGQSPNRAMEHLHRDLGLAALRGRIPMDEPLLHACYDARGRARASGRQSSISSVTRVDGALDDLHDGMRAGDSPRQLAARHLEHRRDAYRVDHVDPEHDIFPADPAVRLWAQSPATGPSELARAYEALPTIDVPVAARQRAREYGEPELLDAPRLRRVLDDWSDHQPRVRFLLLARPHPMDAEKVWDWAGSTYPGARERKLVEGDIPAEALTYLRPDQIRPLLEHEQDAVREAALRALGRAPDAATPSGRSR